MIHESAVGSGADGGLIVSILGVLFMVLGDGVAGDVVPFSAAIRCRLFLWHRAQLHLREHVDGLGLEFGFGSNSFPQF